jgi:hypothetical protein
MNKPFGIACIIGRQKKRRHIKGGILMIKEMAMLLLEQKDVYLTEEGKRLLEELVSQRGNQSQGSEK